MQDSGTLTRETLTAGVLSDDALDERLAIVGTSGSGKTYAAKGLVEHLLAVGARVCVVDPLGVWWGLRACAEGETPGFPVVVFGGRHADVPLHEGSAAVLARLVGERQLACVIDLSELGSAAARRRFMTSFAEVLYEANAEPLHLVLDEADLWAPQRPLPEANALLGRIEEIVRRGRVRGFVPWLITQRPAVVHKDVLSQADILIMMKLTSSQDRDAVGGWIEGQADRAEGKRILADLPKLARGEGYLWAPSDDVLTRVTFPEIRTFDSSRTPKRGERITAPRTLAAVDLSAITAALSASSSGEVLGPARGSDRRRVADLEHQIVERDRRLLEVQQRAEGLSNEVSTLRARLANIASLATVGDELPPPELPNGAAPAPALVRPEATARPAPARLPVEAAPDAAALHPAARKLLAALAQHAPARFTWGQAATLAGLKPSGGHYNAGRKQVRDLGLVKEAADLVTVTAAGMQAAGEVAPAPSSAAERLDLWCARLLSPAPEMLRSLAAQGDRYMEPANLALLLGKKPTGGHWNSGIALLRNNGLVEVSGKRLRIGELFR